MTKSEIFKFAWVDAHYLATTLGGNAVEYFAECLKKSHMINRTTAVSFEQKEYAVDVAYAAITILADGAVLARAAGKNGYADAAMIAIAKIKQMKIARQILDSLIGVNFRKGSDLKLWLSSN
ncbi:hypothetical protein AB6D34_09320 [Pectobacterium brasiliense]|uniref:Uncharacterized protein n=1 Tax=Pectobacterium brasiliense TaxID=180957 RepID=A0A3S1AKD0_9GAMM|nr:MULTISPECIES: hypothetical protein [Pectobacterium]GKW27789.1 hypothetical protein PEC331060_09670 [Pectobacterium carotovorum subsp. carotovorum]MBN3046528.1 hypothetical protein [Pectobacterium brasiliense]MBN3056781.1 hypothetical protein [Pectobacterium brasiliense]MBN3075339.1 hypothetical protein [Pectobacterium brasiliense]MBN3083535.1 hypothetical protein [Pectobacterium brasiliense]